MFPPGVFGESNQITWQGIPNLRPSLLVTNVIKEHQIGTYTFLSGILFGVFGGASITLLVEVIDARREHRKEKGNGKEDSALAAK